MSERTVADAIVECLAARGVRRIFGVPGGDCNLDIIEAGQRLGVEFVLTRCETAAAIMASVSGELTGAPGVVMTTRGPGLASVANGASYATLDRAPLLVIADNYEPGLDHVSHQRIDQAALLRPVVKGESDLSGADPYLETSELLDTALAEPPGAVYLEITGPRVRELAPQSRPAAVAATRAAVDSTLVSAAGALVARASRPVIIAGLQARSVSAAQALRRLAAHWGCPVLVTYKAKGAISDDDPHALGCYIGGVAEQSVIESSDLVVLYGFDPIEGPAAKWRYDKPLVELTEHAFDRPLVTADVSIVGDIAATADQLSAYRNGPRWPPEELADAKAKIHLRARTGTTQGVIVPQDVVDACWEVLPQDARIAVDAGAHMLPVLHLWRTPDPRGALVSRGLATMGFALPAAIASALEDPQRTVIAFTGDGGLMMCASELATAAQYGCKLIVVVFNDSCLTLIGAKQRRRRLPNAGVDLSDVNFAKVAEGYGCAGFRVERPEEMRPALAAALADGRTAVVDIVVDPATYYDQIISLRG